MAYKNVELDSEEKYKQLYEVTYCNGFDQIVTHDGITVKFNKAKFEHAFYESANRAEGDKSIFSKARAEKILWINDVLKDTTCPIKAGWDQKTRCYDHQRRVAIKNDYVVIIEMIGEKEAVFVTAYTADNSIAKIVSSPEWTNPEV